MKSVIPLGGQPVPATPEPPRPLLDRWFMAWLARAEQRWRASAPPYSRYY